MTKASSKRHSPRAVLVRRARAGTGHDSECPGSSGHEGFRNAEFPDRAVVEVPWWMPDPVGSRAREPTGAGSPAGRNGSRDRDLTVPWAVAA
ncbi:hypothetical protein CEP50_15995 [Actinopolyspora mortivallis]|uniref:Uncharacterized protein n=1 Tax=Actinopolyspora mortivallis TaxID=33906 RepID=A0A2T0GT79_ACTMO|nr:hypothetical protein CEP50_15995 [Actinopolyspora mortivallis]